MLRTLMRLVKLAGAAMVLILLAPLGGATPTGCATRDYVLNRTS